MWNWLKKARNWAKSKVKTGIKWLKEKVVAKIPKPVLYTAIVVGAGVIVGVTLAGVVPGLLAAAGALLSLAAVEFRHSATKDKLLVNIYEKRATIADLVNDNATKKIERDQLQNQVIVLQPKIKSLSSEVQQLCNNNHLSQESRDKLEEEFLKLRHRNNQLLQLIAENNLEMPEDDDVSLDDEVLLGGGSGIATLNSYKKLFYSILHVNECLKLSEHCKSENTSLLSAVISNKAGFKKLAENINNLFLNDLQNFRVIFPYLDVEQQHWYTAEIYLLKDLDKYNITISLHDPRGCGKMALSQILELKEILTKTISKTSASYHLDITNPESPYKSCRQSKPDKISCGPIVIEEINLLLQNKPLDRSIPYGFGASELVNKQSISANKKLLLSEIVKNRYQFLSDTPSFIKKQSIAKLGESQSTEVLKP